MSAFLASGKIPEELRSSSFDVQKGFTEIHFSRKEGVEHANIDHAHVDYCGTGE